MKALVPQIVVNDGLLEVHFVDTDTGAKLSVYQYLAPAAITETHNEQ